MVVASTPARATEIAMWALSETSSTTAAATRFLTRLSKAPCSHVYARRLIIRLGLKCKLAAAYCPSSFLSLQTPSIASLYIYATKIQNSYSTVVSQSETPPEMPPEMLTEKRTNRIWCGSDERRDGDALRAGEKVERVHLRIE